MPERFVSHSTQSVHQLPFSFVAAAFHSCGSGGKAAGSPGTRIRHPFPLEGGLTIPAMCPLEDKVKCGAPPSNRAPA